MKKRERAGKLDKVKRNDPAYERLQQDAKERAATSALNTITSEPTSPFADKVAEMVLNRWSELSSKEQRRSLSRTVVAGIVMERERELDPHGYYVQGEGGGQNMQRL